VQRRKRTKTLNGLQDFVVNLRWRGKLIAPVNYTMHYRIDSAVRSAPNNFLHDRGRSGFIARVAKRAVQVRPCQSRTRPDGRDAKLEERRFSSAVDKRALNRRTAAVESKY
jgi:hypothetical protein